MSAGEAIGLTRSCLPRVRTADGTAAESAGLGIEGSWQGSSWSGRLRNAGSSTVCVKEVVLFAGRLPYPPETGLYAEGFQKLSQYAGTLAAPACFGTYSDRDHCRLPQTPGAFTVYNLLLLSPPGGGFLLMAAASCRRFSAEFRIFPDQRVELVLDAESRSIPPGGQWDLEEFFAQAGADREDLLGALAERIQHNHPRLSYPQIPAGWCSWYHYYADVTEADILANLDAISARIPALKYVQIDDGFQARMGDWLTPGTAFSGGVRRLCEEIRTRGFEPALWVAPFIAEEDSAVFREHPDWFISDDSGKPLRSDLVSNGGWRRAPWYALDGTHPGVQDHFEVLFRSLRTDWGCSYFKLDANFWGALHGGRFHDPEATRVEAYRRGMEAVLRGAGDAFVLGCNAPMWPSLGRVHGMRVTDDIGRRWRNFQQIARELFHRNWQNGRLWMNDPDCACLVDCRNQQATPDEYRFHATMIYASGGMILSGDNLAALPEERMQLLRKLLPPTGQAARFEDASFRVGIADRPGGRAYCVFNWEDAVVEPEIRLPRPARIRDLWTDTDLGAHEGIFRLPPLPAHSGAVLECTWR